MKIEPIKTPQVVTSNVWYTIYDEAYNVPFPNHSDGSKICFAELIRCLKLTEKLRMVYRIAMETSPYTPEQAAWWVSECDSLGFPMEFECLPEASSMLVKLEFDKFMSRVHVAHALMLARCLQEDRMFYIPQIYSNLVAEGDTREQRFEKIQLAHFDDSLRAISPNTNHMITYAGIQGKVSSLPYPNNWVKSDPISWQEFWEKMKAHAQKVGVPNPVLVPAPWGRPSISDFWKKTQ